MCSPIGIAVAGLALSGAQATMSYIGQRSQANKTEADQKKYTEENTRQAINAQRVNEADILHRQSQELLATTTQKNDVNQSVQMDLSTERVAAADAGVGGNSVDAVLADIKNSGSKETTRLDVNSGMTQDQLQRNKQATIVSAQNAINSVRPVQVNKPSLAVPILNVAGAALQAYDYTSSRNARAATPPSH